MMRKPNKMHETVYQCIQCCAICVIKHVMTFFCFGNCLVYFIIKVGCIMPAHCEYAYPVHAHTLTMNDWTSLEQNQSNDRTNCGLFTCSRLDLLDHCTLSNTIEHLYDQKCPFHQCVAVRRWNLHQCLSAAVMVLLLTL
jgi:hypothetical protein